MQPGLRDEHERAISHRRLTRYWGHLGFEPFRNQTLVLDLSLATLTKVMHELTGHDPRHQDRRHDEDDGDDK